MKIVSMKQLREKFHPIRKSLEKGESFLLMYRSKPLGILRPYEAGSDAEHLLPPGEEKALLSQPEPLKTLPAPQRIGLDESVKPLDKLGLKKAFL